MPASVVSVETLADTGLDVDVVSKPLTLEEFFDLPYELCELVEGQPILMNSPALHHQYAVTQLLLMLNARCPKGYAVLASPLDWTLWGGPLATVRQPDLVVARLEQVREVRLVEPPLLAIEVVSNSSIERDLIHKRRDYARAGCPHYWIVLPVRPEIVRLRLEGEVYVEAGRITGRRPRKIDEPYSMTIDPRRLVP